MKTIEERADEYIGYSYEKDEGYIVTSKRCAFINGAHSEHAELTRWHDPQEELPKEGRCVLLKVANNRDYTENTVKYYTGAYVASGFYINGIAPYSPRFIVAWREIHE